MNTPTERMTKLFDYPYGSYLMLRLEYACICNDELEAMIMRLIEMRVDDERKRLYQKQINDMPKGTTPPEQLVDVEKSLWVQISHRLFMYDLYGLIKSENTLKKALKALIAKKFIFVRHAPKSRYDAPEYQLNVELIQAEFNKLSNDKRGYQPLTPSIPDTLNNLDHQELTPSEGQELTPSSEIRVSEVDPNSRTGNGNNILEEDSFAPPSDDANTHTLFPDEHTQEASYSQNTPPSPERSGKRARKPKVVKPPKEKSPADVLSEQQQAERAVFEEKRKAIQAKINEWRGYELEEKLELIKEREAVRTLTAKYKLEQIEFTRNYIRKNDKYWSLPENRDRIGGVTLLKEIAKILARIKQREQMQVVSQQTTVAPTELGGYKTFIPDDDSDIDYSQVQSKRVQQKARA